jgi:hypothetical protein
MMRNCLVISVGHRIRPTNAIRAAAHQVANQFLPCEQAALHMVSSSDPSLIGV